MDYIAVLLLLSFVWTCIILLNLLPIGRKPKTASLSPPRPLPIIGNILKLGDKPHLSFANLSKTYGPVMYIKLVSVTTIVIFSLETAKEVLHRHYQAFSGRTVSNAVRAHNHHESSVVWLPASAQWHKIRKICSMQMSKNVVVRLCRRYWRCSLCGKPYGDYFPTLRLIDPQGVWRKMKIYLGKLFDKMKIYFGKLNEDLFG